jgi:hypothetical protein
LAFFTARFSMRLLPGFLAEPGDGALLTMVDHTAAT